MGRNTCYDVDDEHALDLFDALVQDSLGVARVYRHPSLLNDRTRVDALVDDVHGDTRLCDAGCERIPNRVGAGKVWQQCRVRVDEVWRESAHHIGRKNSHQSRADHEIGMVPLDFREKRLTPRLSVRMRGGLNDKRWNREFSGVIESRTVVISTYCDNSGIECPRGARFENCSEVAARSRDEDNNFEHSRSVSRRPSQTMSARRSGRSIRMCWVS